MGPMRKPTSASRSTMKLRLDRLFTSGTGFPFLNKRLPQVDAGEEVVCRKCHWRCACPTSSAW
jgi:hypothetical protein